MKSYITFSRLSLLSLLAGPLVAPSLLADKNYYDVLRTEAKDGFAPQPQNRAKSGTHKTQNFTKKRRKKTPQALPVQELVQQVQEIEPSTEQSEPQINAEKTFYWCTKIDGQSFTIRPIPQQELDSLPDPDYSIQQEALKLYVYDEQYQNIIKRLLFIANYQDLLSEFTTAPLESPELTKDMENAAALKNQTIKELEGRIKEIDSQKITAENAPQLKALLDAVVKKSTLPTQPCLYIRCLFNNASASTTSYDLYFGLTFIIDNNFSNRELKATLAHEVGHLQCRAQWGPPIELPCKFSKEFFEAFFSPNDGALLLLPALMAAHYASTSEPTWKIACPLLLVNGHIAHIAKSYASDAITRQLEEIIADKHAHLIEAQGELTFNLKLGQYEQLPQKSLNFEDYKPLLNKLTSLEWKKSFINKILITWGHFLERASLLIVLNAGLPCFDFVQKLPFNTAITSILVSALEAVAIMNLRPVIRTHPPHSDRAQAAYNKLLELREECRHSLLNAMDGIGKKNESDEDEPIFFI